MGDLSIAKMIEVIAKFCEVKHVKFQKRDVKKILLSLNITNRIQFQKIHLAKHGEHRDFLEFNIEKHKKLKNIVKK